jgi:alpha/beta superfamily hydrolase
MENNVVRTAASTLQEMGWTTLRFNFRGVGRSEGRPGDGELEVGDAQAALEHLRGMGGGAANRVALIGYSFGAWAGLRALARMAPVDGWAAIAPPVSMWDFTFAKDLQGRKLLLAGDRDEYCPAETFRSFARSLAEADEWALLPGVDHFFWGAEEELSGLLRERLTLWMKEGKSET